MPEPSPIITIDFHPDPDTEIKTGRLLLKDAKPIAVIVETLSTGQLNDKVVEWLEEEIAKRRKAGDETPFIMLPRDRGASDHGLTEIDHSKPYRREEEIGLIPLGGANWDKHLIQVETAISELHQQGIDGQQLATELQKQFPGESRERDREGMLRRIQSQEPGESEQPPNLTPEL